MFINGNFIYLVSTTAHEKYKLTWIFSEMYICFWLVSFKRKQHILNFAILIIAEHIPEVINTRVSRKTVDKDSVCFCHFLPQVHTHTPSMLHVFLKNCKHVHCMYGLFSLLIKCSNIVFPNQWPTVTLNCVLTRDISCYVHSWSVTFQKEILSKITVVLVLAI